MSSSETALPQHNLSPKQFSVNSGCSFLVRAVSNSSLQGSGADATCIQHHVWAWSSSSTPRQPGAREADVGSENGEQEGDADRQPGGLRHSSSRRSP